MSVVLSVRIPRELKEEMDRLKGFVNWSEEIRRFIEERVRFYKRLSVLRELDHVLDELPSTPRGLAARMVREDRDGT